VEERRTEKMKQESRTQETYFEKLLEKYKNKNLSKDLELQVGDQIAIAYKLIENGKERIQNFEGVILSKQNKNLSKSILIRRIVEGVAVEQVFLLHSPKILSIRKKQSSKVRRAKLYYLRNLFGKKARLKLKKG
jgi:large subunit ribosomal protein L19